MMELVAFRIQQQNYYRRTTKNNHVFINWEALQSSVLLVLDPSLRALNWQGIKKNNHNNNDRNKIQ